MSLTTSEYSTVLKGEGQEVMEREPLTAMLGNPTMISRENESIANYKEIKKYVMDYSKIGLLDYDGEYPEGSLTGQWQTHMLEYDRALKFSFDKIDSRFGSPCSGVSVGSIMGSIQRNKVIPEVDATNIERCFNVIETAKLKPSPTAVNILSEIEKAINEICELGLDESALQLFMNYETRQMLIECIGTKNSQYIADLNFVAYNGVSYTLPSINGVAIQVMPKNRFYTKVKRFIKADYITNPLNNGYAKADDGKDIAWMIVPKNYATPVSILTDLKIKLDNVENTKNRNNEAAYNIVFDCIIEKNVPKIADLFKAAVMAPAASKAATKG